MKQSNLRLRWPHTDAPNLGRYGRGHNEQLEGHRHEYMIASKFSNQSAAEGSPAVRVLGRCIRQSDGFAL